MADSLFPHINKAISNFMYDQEGNIPRNKILTVGTMMLLLSIMLVDEVLADHRSHTSHRSHSSHSSGSGGGHYSHTSHQSHSSHTSGSSHSSHGSSTHSNTHSSHSSNAHSNSVPTTRTHSSHSNAAPSIKELKIPVPGNSDTIDLATGLSLTSMGEVPPETTSVVIGSNNDN